MRHIKLFKMIFYFNVFLILFFSRVNGSLCASITDQEDKLIGVAVMYRHGDRGPSSSYPNDPYLDIKYWPNGFGQLLDKGKLRLFNSGKWLRERYNSFLPEIYNYRDIYVRSTDVDRTLMSASSSLAGLYYPTGQQSLWQKNLAWDPIPIHTEPESGDAVLSMSKTCPNYEELYNRTLQSKVFKDILEEHSEIREFVEEKTGWKITDLKHFQGLYTVFYVYLMHNKTYLPNWYYQLDAEELGLLAGISFSIETSSDALRRYKVGPFLNYLQSYFDGIINGTNPKFLMLSAHDGTIAGLLNTYGVYDFHPIDFGETIIWEIYEDANSDIFLKFYNRRDDILEEFILKGCVSEKCGYNEYLDSFKDITVDLDLWEIECNQKNFDNDTK